MFTPVSSKVKFPEMESTILQLWRDGNIFHRTESERPEGPLFMLYEGPPTANGSPGIHHVLARVFKDVICRYKTMKGYRCIRKGGWDTHGLPVELEVEKALGLASKGDIEEYGIEKFNQKCRESVFRYVKEWEDMTDRIAFWVDMEHPYVTLENDYIETGWWILRQLWDKGLLCQDIKGTPHCPRCVTSLSSHEVALGYQEDTPDPSVFVKFRVRQDAALAGHPAEGAVPTYFLAWTTTPWTLPGNTGLAVDPSAEYSLVEMEGTGGPERLILASALVEQVVGEPSEVVDTFRGATLVGLTYDSLYDPRKYGVEVWRFSGGDTSDTSQVASPSRVASMEVTQEYSPRVFDADFVSLEDGTGIVHIAPAFGDEDLTAGREKGLHFVQPVDLRGIITGTYPFAGKFVKEADEDIMADLQDRGNLYRREVYHHTYPFCWRCDTPLLYYAKASWYIRTTALKDRLISGNQEISWYPDYIKEGRFGEWLRNNVDWAISRERYWGTPIPLWQCGSCGHLHCVGSLEELKDLAVPEHRDRLEGLELHRPYVDQIAVRCPSCQGEMSRIPEVMDAWFDSGAMPYSQWHYPFEAESLAQDGRFPADYICEAVDQTRGWFYTLHALSTLLMGQPCYRNVICLGLILDGQGQKMSKRQGNVVSPWTVLDAQGADATRWYLFTASQPGESRRFSQDLVNEVVRRFLLTLWNVYSFFITYASVDQFHPEQMPQDWKPTSELDRWLLSELNALTLQVDRLLGAYNPTDAGRRIQEFVDLLSNWYVRRSRRRFWKSEGDDDKLSAYCTLYTCLVTLCKIIAPFMPFVAEEMYQNLVRSVAPQDGTSTPESVHLALFPEGNPDLVDQPLMDATRLAMRVSSMGRGARSRAGVKVRQPLTRVLVKPRSPEEEEHLLQVRPQILDELNVKEMEVVRGGGLTGGDQGGLVYRKAVEAAGASPDDEDSRTQVEAMVQVDGHWVSLEAGYMVAVDTAITPELAQEGLARELVHRIQNLRRGANFEITDRIVTYYQVAEGQVAEGQRREGLAAVQEVVRRFGDYIQQETLSEALVEGEPEVGAHMDTQKVEGMEMVLGVRRV